MLHVGNDISVKFDFELFYKVIFDRYSSSGYNCGSNGINSITPDSLCRRKFPSFTLFVSKYTINRKLRHPQSSHLLLSLRLTYMFCSLRLWSSLSNLMKIKWVLNIQPFYLQSLWNDSFMETTNKTLTAYFFLPCLKKLESCFRILFYLFPFLLILEWIDTCFWKCMFCLGLFFCDFIIEIVLIFSVKSVNTYLLCCLDCLWFCSLQIFKEP